MPATITIIYKGFHIVPKLDIGHPGFLIEGKWVKTGWVVTDGHCNILPGATWAQTVEGAKSLIRAHIKSHGDAPKFWEIVKETAHERNT